MLSELWKGTIDLKGGGTTVMVLMVEEKAQGKQVGQAKPQWQGGSQRVGDTGMGFVTTTPSLDLTTPRRRHAGHPGHQGEIMVVVPSVTLSSSLSLSGIRALGMHRHRIVECPWILVATPIGRQRQ